MSDSGDGLQIVLSAPQLAAVIAGETISPEATLTNRLFGGVKVVGGVLELLGAGALCLVPEPTMTTKAGCFVFGSHGVDTTLAGGKQVWTGADTNTLTQEGVAKLARTIGIEAKSANNIGLAIDIGVPLAFSAAILAMRVAAVKAGRINLVMHEAPPGSAVGGHTIVKHIGKSEASLRQRLVQEPHIPAATTFSKISVAEEAISRAMKLGGPQITNWAQKCALGAGSNKLRLEVTLGKVIGAGVVRSTGKLTPMTRIRIILKYETFNGQPYYVLTAFPCV
jgi:hypothetical protein